MELKGLTINFLGDSITEGKGVLIPENRFTDRIAVEGKCICRNYGVGGTRIARQTKASDPTRYDLDYNARFLCMDHNADLIVVFGGTNDFGHGDAPMGSRGDSSVYIDNQTVISQSDSNRKIAIQLQFDTDIDIDTIGEITFAIKMKSRAGINVQHISLKNHETGIGVIPEIATVYATGK